MKAIPEGLRRAYILVLAPLAAAAAVPLFWSEGALPSAVLLYECAVLLIWARARAGRTIRLSDSILNVIGLSYCLWLVFEVWILRHGLLRSVSHLLLFTALAKLASLKRPGEARTALLVLFLLTLASASSSTHVSSLVYFAAIAFLGFRTLGRLAVLADFDDAPPDRVIGSVPTGGLAFFAVFGAALLTVPLFYALPRLRSPFALAPIRLEDALSTTLTADRVELGSFGAAKKSDRVVLTMVVDPQRALDRALRLREAVFTEYRDGVWTRNPYMRPASRARPDVALPRPRAGIAPDGRVSIDLNLFTNGFLFLPYGSTGLEIERGFPASLPDGVVQLASNRRAVRYTVGLQRGAPRGLGSSAIDPASVPAEVRDYGARLTGDLADPLAIYERIRDHFASRFVYTLDPPSAEGDPVVNFLLRSRAGHCEFFASATAMMLASRGIPARLVTGSYGGEVGFLSRGLVVRAGNLHAWVEANVDGAGFSVLDPTPPAGIPEATSRISVWKRLTGIAREFEFFYDRRILGFDAFDQVQALEAARQSLGRAAERLDSLKQLVTGRRAREAGAGAAALLLLVGLFVALRRLSRQVASAPATRAYVTLRRLLARRVGALSPALAPAEVARLFAEAVPPAREDAHAVVDVYCAAEFGGRPLDVSAVTDLAERVRRLKRA